MQPHQGFLQVNYQIKVNVCPLTLLQLTVVLFVKQLLVIIGEEMSLIFIAPVI